MAASPKPRCVAEREDLFVAMFIKTQDRAASAIAAGYSAKTAKAKGKELWTRLQDRIAKVQRERVDAAMLAADEVDRNLAEDHRVDRRGFWHKDGRPKLPHELTEAEARLLEGYEVEVLRVGKDSTITATKIKLTKHIAVRDQAMRRKSMFPRETPGLDPEDAARQVREALGDITKLTNAGLPHTKEKGK